MPSEHEIPTGEITLLRSSNSEPRMSLVGQKGKISDGANVVRFSPESGQKAGVSGRSLCARTSHCPRCEASRRFFNGWRLLLWDERLSRRPESGNLNYHLTVLRP